MPKFTMQVESKDAHSNRVLLRSDGPEAASFGLTAASVEEFEAFVPGQTVVVSVDPAAPAPDAPAGGAQTE